MSVVETVTNLTAGLLLSIFVVQPIVFSHYDVVLTHGDNTAIAVIFTIVSLIRGYITRRIFNYLHNRKLTWRYFAYGVKLPLLVKDDGI